MNPLKACATRLRVAVVDNEWLTKKLLNN
ncbi:PTS transporter subunit EIIB [Enterococcus faecium]|nr:PTS transporter subunit EIIB [Enterococcus faecium]